MLVKSNAPDGLPIGVDSDEAVKRGPQPLAVNWQNDLIQIAAVFSDFVGDRVNFSPSDLRQSTVRRNINTVVLFLRCFLWIVSFEVDAFFGGQLFGEVV